MVKSEPVDLLQEAFPEISRKDAERCLSAVFEEITGAMAAHNRVELRGFGTFSVRERCTRKARNPKTGELVTVPAKRVPFFKASKLLHARMNKKSASQDDIGGSEQTSFGP